MMAAERQHFLKRQETLTFEKMQKKLGADAPGFFHNCN